MGISPSALSVTTSRIRANRYEIVCPTCGTVNEYGGPWEGAAEGGA